MQRLIDKEFNMLAGTEVFLTMLRNRIAVPGDVVDEALEFLTEIPSQGFWYSCAMNPNHIYIESIRVAEALEARLNEIKG